METFILTGRDSIDYKEMHLSRLERHARYTCCLWANRSRYAPAANPILPLQSTPRRDAGPGKVVIRLEHAPLSRELPGDPNDTTNGQITPW